MKLRLRTVSLWLLAFVVIVTVGALLARHRGERALERKLAELRAQGEKLTVREIFGEPRPGDAQHHIRFDGVLGQLTGAPSWASSVDRMKLLAPARAPVLWSPETGVPDERSVGSFLATWAVAAQDVAGVREALDRLRTELGDPPRTAGGDYTVDPNPALKPNYVRLRIASQWLSGAVTLAMHEQDTGGALTNLTALLNLSQAYRDDPPLVTHMIRVAIAGLGTAATWDVLQSDTWTEPQLAVLQDAVERADVAANAARGIEGDRAWVFTLGNNQRTNRAPNRPSIVAGMGMPKPAAHVVKAAWRGVLAPRDLVAYLDEMQVQVDAARSVRDGVPWPKVAEELKSLQRPRTAMAEWHRTYFTPFSYMAIPSMDKALLSIARNETLRQMTLAAIAIRRHELRHGRPPASIEALVPALLPKLPHDSFSGQPLRYRTTEDGGYVLYSVGADGQDDGGNATPTTNDKSWTIWDSPDAVWPKPLEE